MRGARTAVAFLTRLPVGPWPLVPLAAAAGWFWLPGLLVGGLVAGIRALGEDVAGLQAAPATVLAVLAGVVVTGALHEDGLADTADGLGVHGTRERRLEVLRDPRLGTFGAVALVGALALAITALAGLDVGETARAAVVAHVLARTALLPPSRLVAPARTDGSGRLLHASPAATAIAIAMAVVVALVGAGIGPGLVCLGVAALATVGTTAMFARAFGGLTGDGYGAIAKLVELAVLLVLAATWT